ncbi:MAG: nucleotidyltransferase domain-containing protein [Anaerolineales bacterium]|nr:nucleotidyltransferase domain-containing protein [Anaerolineales bacterium]
MSKRPDSGSHIVIRDFEPELALTLPATYALLADANLTLHPRVTQVVLHGSRGLSQTYRPDSDIDLTLIVSQPAQQSPDVLETQMRDVFTVTQANWLGAVEADLAVVFETRACGLVCFGARQWHEQSCTLGGVDCFGLFKAQRGFDGLVWNAGVQVQRMVPSLIVWRCSLPRSERYS